MGEIADSMINGEFCAECGVYLSAGEIVFEQSTGKRARMPRDGKPYGLPVICRDCKD